MLYDVHFKEEPPNLEEKETLYREPPKGNATVKLLWQENEAVGFYFYRCKGTSPEFFLDHRNFNRQISFLMLYYN